jgi:hypothetical protein
MSVTLYQLKISGQLICEVTLEVPFWLPIRPRLNRAWLRATIAQAARYYFSAHKSIN